MKNLLRKHNENIDKFANVIAAKYVTVNKLYSLNAKTAKILDMEKSTQEIKVSLHGS